MSQGKPWSKDQIGSWTVAAAAGQQAYRNGASALDVVDIAVRWRFWYKAMGINIIFCIGALWLFRTVPAHMQYPLLIAQGVLSLLIFGISYAKLIYFSGFRRRWLFRRFWWMARHLPNVANFWLYMVPAIPTWLMIYNGTLMTARAKG